MDVDALIDAYIENVTQLLPPKQRADVALELHGLVREELQSRAAAQGRALDAAIALEGLRAFGKPQDVAARYFEPWVIIPATETRRFLFAAIIGVLVLIALSPLGDTASRTQEVQSAIFIWLGVLVSWFGAHSAVRRWRGSNASLWVPRDRDNASRMGSIALIVLIGVGIVAYGAPRWLFSQLTQGGSLTAWLDYDPTFHSARLPVLFFLWGCQAVMLVVLAIRGRWNSMLRRVDVGLEIGVALVLVWFVAAGVVFKEAVPNNAALSAISVFALLLFIDIGVKLYRGLGRSGLSLMQPNDGRA